MLGLLRLGLGFFVLALLQLLCLLVVLLLQFW